MLKHWTKNPFCPGGARRGWAADPVKEKEEPPAVAEARRKLGLSIVTRRERSRTPDRSNNSCTILQTLIRGQNVVNERAREELTSTSTGEVGEADPDVPPGFHRSGLRLTLHSGETLTKARLDAPWLPDQTQGKQNRGQSKLAIQIAGDEQMRQEAMTAYDALVYATGSTQAKDALFTTWVNISKAKHEEPLPLTTAKIRENAAILRSAGYRAVKSYVYEAKDRHSRAGYPWSAALQIALQDAKRMAQRAIGQVERAGEVKLEVWAMLITKFGKHPYPNEAAQGAPNAGALTWILGTKFLLREVELASLTLDTKCVQLDLGSKVATLRLPVSKTDVAGRGAARAFGCYCQTTGDVCCPFHVLVEIVNNQCQRLRVHDRSVLPEGAIPLIGQIADAGLYVDKKEMICEAQRMVKLANVTCPESSIAVETITGHFMRRSGVKDMARRGCAFTTIQWYARHSSKATWDYIEEAWGDTPEQALKLKSEVEFSEALANTLRRVDCLEEAIKVQTNSLEEALHHDGFNVECEETKKEMRKEARRALLPLFVVNLSSGAVHRPCHSFSPLVDPKKWTTKCGWPWVQGDVPCQFVYEGDDLKPTTRKCLKCFGG